MELTKKTKRATIAGSSFAPAISLTKNIYGV
nr:MAG TPA: hypothetical protein [Caudoviricetes sp.]